MKKLTVGDLNALIILVGQKLNLNAIMVEDAIRQLTGQPLHPISGAAMEKAAIQVHDSIRENAAMVEKANNEAKIIAAEYGFVCA